MEEKQEYKGFNIYMALVDLIPVVLFAICFGIIATRYPNVLFIVGTVLSSEAGIIKVLWKVFIALAKKDIRFFYKQFKYTMSAGMLLMIISMFVLSPKVEFNSLWNAIISLPSIIFFVIGFILMGCMFVLAAKLDPNNAKSNWIEQGVNTLAQLCFLLGVIFC